MKFILLTPIVSPHQLPFSDAMVTLLGDDNFRYVYTERDVERKRMGWDTDAVRSWIFFRDPEGGVNQSDASSVETCLVECDVLLSGLRDLPLFKKRIDAGRKTLYMSERWFKPPFGMLRLLHPKFFRMAWDFVRLMRKGEVVYLPIGIHAAADMARLVGLFTGALSCLFRAPELVFERIPMGKISARQCRNADLYALNRMRMWGYFVEPSSTSADDEIEARGERDNSVGSLLRILWVGRMLKLKRLDSLITAVTRLLDEGGSIELQLVGSGPEEVGLKKLAGKWLRVEEHGVEGIPGGRSSSQGVTFRSPVSITEVRGFMRRADVYALPSDGYEGWGAVVNEAMAEGCLLLGSRDAGAPATLIEDGVNGVLLGAGCVDEWVEKLRMIASSKSFQSIARCGQKTIQTGWSPRHAAERIADFVVINA